MGVFLVLRCFQCRHFQVIQRRKDRKWTCKLCGGRQSIIKVFASSERAKDCRLVVQELNMRRGRWSRASARTAPGRGEATGGAVVEPLGAGGHARFC